MAHIGQSRPDSGPGSQKGHKFKGLRAISGSPLLCSSDREFKEGQDRAIFPAALKSNWTVIESQSVVIEQQRIVNGW